MAGKQQSRGDDAIRITTAAVSPAEDLRRRQKRYLISMSIRSACFVGACISGLAGVNWLWPILIAGAIVLPYVAVVMANAQATRRDGFELQPGAYGAPQLESRSRHDSLGPR
ncbi:DUF3099 domain-containing protein [Nocardioides acrostichi]|uniref:DUF3099 domain-containing protein n=1 Tax=Nocardioides acrostichi TaxID=2784339 RepID=A0A930V3Q6_9ACTN|nr:DUF3099 domain-containing protein [Nocardioides acrostichi]MBF4163155.1 DUF3099 domain-containing protein [Nocardioides acrostichi]